MEQPTDLRDLEQRVDRARQALDNLRARHADAQQACQHEEIERLEEHLASTEHKLSGLRVAGAEALQELRASIESIWAEITRRIGT